MLRGVTKGFELGRILWNDWRNGKLTGFSSGSGYQPMAGSSEYGIEIPGSIKLEELIE
jgi:hypothetical protein